MNHIAVAVENRERGQSIPISIGTALAIESGCGVHPDHPEMPPPFLRVKQVWVNLRTIVRNLYACLPTDLKDTVLPDDLWRSGLEEMNIILTAVGQATHNRTQVVFYVSDYAKPEKQFPGASLKKPVTPKQIFQQAIEENTLKLMLQNNDRQRVEFFDFWFTGPYPASFIVTHMPVDLLNRYRFERLELLESHTGAIKSPAAWNTKLTNGKELPNVPFNRDTIQLFGDNGNMFAPLSITIRRQVLKLAHTYKWTNVSSLELVRSTFSKVDIDAHREALRHLM